MKPGKERELHGSPRRMLLWTALVGLIFGLIGFGEIAEDRLRAARNSVHTSNASSDIILVSIDDQSLREIGRWPWPRSVHGQLADKLSQAGAKRIFFDLMFETATNPEEDGRLAGAIARSGRVTLAVRARSGPSSAASAQVLPLEMFAKNAELGSISVIYNYQNAVWKIPYATAVGGEPMPSFAAKLAGVSGRAESSFTPDYSIDPASIPVVSASQVLDGSAPTELIAGKDVVIGANSELIGDQYFLPGWGKMGGAYIQIIGAETLKSGTPVNFGWIPVFALALVLASFAAFRKSVRTQTAVIATGAVLLLAGPALLEAKLLFVDVTPALFVVITVGCALAWRRMRLRGLVNSLSGLPNLDALRCNREGRDKALITARVLNYEEAVATLPPESEHRLIEQIIARLRLGSPDRILYQGDGGIFAWFEEPRLPFANHLEALYALFRNPARVAGMPIDLSVAFGVEIGSNRSLASRLASAAVAAEEAAHDGLKWKYHDPDSLSDASWRLSMLSQLDEAVDKGEVWVAYQPKLELSTGRIVGAEALARWTHPQKGPIAASEFIAAAEQHDRIAKLTDFVLEQALAAAAALSRRDPGFGIAVNLSARLLADKGLTIRLAAMLARHHVPAHQLTLELTETATLAGSGSAIEMLASLRGLGVAISIDDYGTGLSTLDYLKKIPANEIKIDQSFVRGLIESRSDRLMVQSTIGLAHSLGRKVVAEGVERREVLEALAEMECDVAQGFIIGRPMSLESLAKRIGAANESRVA